MPWVSSGKFQFGLRQVWLQLIGRPYTHLAFGTPGPYRLVRHPLFVGWLLKLWAAPTMGVSRLNFAVATTGYFLIAVLLEERLPMLVTVTRKRHLDDAFLRRQRGRVPLSLMTGAASRLWK